MTGHLAFVLGYSNGMWYTPAGSVTKSIASPEKPDIDTKITSLFVYLNIVAPQTIGNSRVQLLRSVTILRETKHANVVREFKNTDYLAVESGNYITLKINIYRNNGERVALEGGKVIVIKHLEKSDSAMDKRQPYHNHD